MVEVINVKVANIRPQYNDLEEWMDAKEENIYIGRSGRVFIGAGKNRRVFHYPASKWCNPFKVKDHGREDSLLLYEKYIREKIVENPVHFDLSELAGKRLGCWCSPFACHGDILLQVYAESQKIKDTDINQILS